MSSSTPTLSGSQPTAARTRSLSSPPWISSNLGAVGLQCLADQPARLGQHLVKIV
ncbi:hypothetical protein ABID21_000181 [Pseudorhizobium tarimense]|uniref:Uncharacterized protein n=1 Tax=Pseudorhizobium tarimense TaxID=1079109 RepID=A0ABV2H0Q4_9HYPH|nr:hypothetical protein [Pseudorhizobium tarimense]MCJ8517422.1 hypothetical protein [Pseudorhizobium tarimense]